MTERLHFHFSLSCIGEGNGNPLQCSCLENPRDRGAWWAAVSGVTQSRTQLKRLSSSSSCTAGWLFTIWATREAWAPWKVAPNWPKGGRSLLGCLFLLGWGLENYRSGSLLQLDRVTQDALLMCYSSDSWCLRVVHYHFTTFPLWWDKEIQRIYKEFSFVSCVTSRIYSYA